MKLMYRVLVLHGLLRECEAERVGRALSNVFNFWLARLQKVELHEQKLSDLATKKLLRFQFKRWKKSISSRAIWRRSVFKLYLTRWKKSFKSKTSKRLHVVKRNFFKAKRIFLIWKKRIALLNSKEHEFSVQKLHIYFQLWKINSNLSSKHGLWHKHVLR
jgi:hypothetical protein